MGVLLDASTIETDKRVVVVSTGTHPLAVEISIDGEAAHLLPGYSADIMRDGGTRWFKTDRGHLVMPNRLADRDKPEDLRAPPTLDGEPIGRPFPTPSPAKRAAVRRMAAAESAARAQ